MVPTPQRVLIVDDDRVVADTLSLIFEKGGFDAFACYSAEEALVHARGFHPHLLLCDVAMPGRDGMALVRDISQEFPSCRFLVLTGFYANLHRIKQYADRMPLHVGVFTKPCQPADLLREATAMLANA